MPLNLPFISVIIPVYNGEKFIPFCLDALLASEYEGFEVIVVDDGSTDNSALISREKGVTVMSSERRQSGPAAARNLAAKAANGNILLFVDADVVVKNDTLAKIGNVFRNQPEISALFGSYDDEPGEKNFLSQYKNLQHHFVHQNSNPEAFTFWAGLGAVRKDIFLSVGGFDCVKFAIPSIEDIELGFRLRKEGHRILLDPTIQGKHLKKWTFGSLVKTEIFCRAVPWSKLILTSQGMINDMNLKTNDRLSSGFVALSLLIIPFIFWKPILLLLLGIFIITIVFLNIQIFKFFYKSKGILFAIFTFPWLFFYFFYCGFTFVVCWLIYGIPKSLNIKKSEKIREVS